MKQNLKKYAIMSGIGLTSVLITVIAAWLANVYFPDFYYESRYHGKSHQLHLVGLGFSAAYIYWACSLSRSKHPQNQQLLKIITAPGYLALLIFFILLIIRPF